MVSIRAEVKNEERKEKGKKLKHWEGGDKIAVNYSCNSETLDG